jgi:hypothetical protein
MKTKRDGYRNQIEWLFSNKTSTRKEIRKMERKRNETKFRSCFDKIRADEIGIVEEKNGRA